MNASCSAAIAFGPPHASVVRGDLNLGGSPYLVCGGSDDHALFYAVDVPVGQRLYVTAKATTDHPTWAPRLAAFDSCEATYCLAQGGLADGGTPKIDWINNGPATHHVIVAVSSRGEVTAPEVEVRVGLTDLFASCARPVPVQDGTTFVNIGLDGVVASPTTCAGPNQPALYYVATLRPFQELTTSVANAGANLGIRTSCDDGCSNSSSPNAGYYNATAQEKTVLVEVTRSAGPVDLRFSIPPPPSGVIVTPTSALVTSERGDFATFQVVLASQPTAPVAVGITSTRPTEGRPSPALVTFDATNWHTPQTVTVTGVDDAVGDGAQSYTIVTAPARSDDPLYAGVDGDDLPFTNLDDEASLVLDGADELVTSEDGTAETFTVRLDVQPTASVTVPLASSNVGEGTVSPASLTFTPSSWNVPQTVTVTGADDRVVDGPRPYAVDLGPLVSTDTQYEGLTPASVAVTNRDDDLSDIENEVIGTGNCGIAGTPNQFPVAVDDAGRIYVVVECDDHLELFTSADGGATFSKPIAIPATSIYAGPAIAAGRPGTLYVVVEAWARGLQLMRTLDAGATWSVRPIAPTATDLLRVAAARDTVVIVGNTPFVSGVKPSSIVLRSDDRGSSFHEQGVLDGQVTALGVARDGRATWIVDDQPQLWVSTGPAAAFTLAGAVDGPPLRCCYVFGDDELFAAEPGRITATSLANPTLTQAFAGGSGMLFAAAIDTANVVTIIDGAGGNLYGTRFTAAGMTASSKPVTISPYLSGAVALSRHAVGIASVAEDGVRFAVASW
ncbi:MAG TPA: hypothetical protein VHJ20_19620 [Polyangia bacterium]|nr:hypothetical protein [Polyangia bacterium]